jgi:hypothetical protein
MSPLRQLTARGGFHKTTTYSGFRDEFRHPATKNARHTSTELKVETIS